MHKHTENYYDGSADKWTTWIHKDAMVHPPELLQIKEFRNWKL